MADATTQLLQALRTRCRQKPGMQASYSDDEYNILGGFLDSFAKLILDETPPVLLIRCRDAVREQLAARFSGVMISQRMHWNTVDWKWTDVVLDGSLPEETLLRLIDDSYDLVYNSESISADTKHEIELIERRLPQREVLEDLIGWCGLSHRRREIYRVVRTALLLKTHPVEEHEIPLGASKLGGLPDLPLNVPWPRYRTGKPLAFLAQVNLKQAAAAARLRELPSSGMLSLFSGCGWEEDEEGDAGIPIGEFAVGWTQVLYCPKSRVPLRRHPSPPKVNTYKAAPVEHVPILSLPDPREPSMTALNWTEDELETLDWRLSPTFKSVRDYLLGHPSQHQLGGFADYEQQFVDAVAESRLQLLFQIASDGNTGMHWGDDGFIYAWISPKNLKRRDFSELLVDFQCG